MSSDKLESFPIRFTDKNYCAWEFQFKLFVKGKELWGHIDGSNPTRCDPETLSKWEIKDAQVVTWILSSVELHLFLNLRPYKTVAAMWNYLHTIYNQDKSARRFQLEYEMTNFTQRSLSIEEYFSDFQTIWTDYSDIVYANVPAAALSGVQTVHATSKRDQFLMKLRPDFEIAQSNMMNCHPIPSLDACLSELLREKQCIAMEHECWQNAMQAELQQEYEVDYEETFAPVAKMTTIRTILAIATSQSWQLHQMDYIQDLITLASLDDTSSVDTPMKVNVKYRKDEGDLLDDPTLYRHLVGSLIYLTTTRPNISYDVHQVSQFMTSPQHLHLAAVRHIIRYLRSSPTRGLFFPTSSSLQLVAYSDVDWVGCSDTRRSTTGWCMFLGDALISWICKKQDRVSKSSTKVEYHAMSIACSEIVWLRSLHEKLGFPQTTSTPLHADNTSAIQIATNPVFHERTKHIEVDCYSIETPWKVG
ncbi:hypothetical protein AAG906_032489 [Vitis piasezkii]